jgi:hypothetical protein
MPNMSDWLPQKSFNHQHLKEDKMTLNEKLNYTEQFEDTIFRLANLMLDTVKIALDTLDDYHKLFDENSNQNMPDDMKI